MNYYCATKFTDMYVDVQSRQVYNCCKAMPERINLEWLQNNPGHLFNTPTMIKDRKLMLDDKINASCDYGCYKFERQGIVSQRSNAEKVFYAQAHSSLQSLDIILSNDCRLTCAYCGPQWSTTWWRDIEKNGNYNLETVDKRSQNWFKLLGKMKQKNRSTNTKFFDLLLREMKLADKLKFVNVLGGEPLLHNDLSALLNVVPDKEITIVTGLGVASNRLKNFLQKYKSKKIRFKVSAETTGKYFEFLRYGNKWEEFCDKIKMISDSGYELVFGSTITNISLLDFANFYNYFNKDYKIKIQLINDKPFFYPNLLDTQSKNNFKKWYVANPQCDPNKLLASIAKPTASENAKKDLANFVKEFSRRRQIDLSFLPKHFIDWLYS